MFSSSSSDYINPFIPSSSTSFLQPPPPLPSSGVPLVFGFASTNSYIPTAASDQAAVVKVKKKVRHSKICTAQGVRERRVRLSVEIAREFFNLHDMLGFDRASKTLEWLLGNSRNAINELGHAKRVPAAAQHEIQSSQYSAGTVISSSGRSKAAATKTGCRAGKKMQLQSADQFDTVAAEVGVEENSEVKPTDHPPIAHGLHQHLPCFYCDFNFLDPPNA